MTKLIKLILPLAVILSAFSGCNNIINNNSQQSQETTAQTSSETVSETTAKQTEAKKELKGDMTIRKAYKLPDLGYRNGDEFPEIIEDKVVTCIRRGEALSKYIFNDEIGKYDFGFYPTDVVVTDAITGEQNTIYSDIMLDTYFIIPGNDEKTAYLLYYDKTNIVDKAAVKTTNDVRKYVRVIKLDLNNMTYKELDFSKYNGNDFAIYPIGDNKIIINQYNDVPATEKDFEGRDSKFKDEGNMVDSITIDVMDLNSGEVKNLYYDKMVYYKVIPGEKKINNCFTHYYDNMVIFQTEELTADNTYKVGFQVYDENMNLIFEDIVDSIDNYQSGDLLDISIGVCDGDIYVSSENLKLNYEKVTADTEVNHYVDYIYHKKGNTFKKSKPKPLIQRDTYAQHTTKTHPEFNYGIAQITYDTNTSTQLKLFNYCTGEKFFLDIDIDGFETPNPAIDGDINYNGSGNTLIFGNGSDRENNLVFWFVPKEEIKRALYGE